MEKERVNNYTKRLWNAKHTTEIRAILKEFEFECASKKSDTSGEALPIADVGGNEVALPADDDVNTESALNMGRTLDMGKQ
jgi:hypothetical protein